MSTFSQLESRGLVHDVSHRDELNELLEKEKISFYCGFDPTADSLHVGSMLPLITMKRLQAAGHRPIALLGAATGMIGDPSGKSEERNLLAEETINKNLAGIEAQIKLFLSAEGDNAFVTTRNDEWINPLGCLEFLRDVGKHFSVNAMIAKDSVKNRLETREQGISFTEFSYMLLQAYDFYWLNQKHNCRLQVGGSDQWGNITAGLELVRKRNKESHLPAYGLTFPLLTTASGAKFGKTEKGAVWLAKERTSPYEFYQYWLNTADADVVNYLKLFTFIENPELAELAEKTAKVPQERHAQKALAKELTTTVHGQNACGEAEEKSGVLFKQQNLSDISADEAKKMFVDVDAALAISESQLANGYTAQQLVVDLQISPSKGAARKLIEGGGVYINDARVATYSEKINAECFIDGEFLILRSGKKKRFKVELKQ